MNIESSALRGYGYAIGKQVYIGEDFRVTNVLETWHCKLTIGDRVAIAQGVTVILDSDPNWSNLAKRVTIVRGQVRIENDARVGACAIILRNIVIVESSILGAGSVEAQNVSPEFFVVGNPARVLRKIE